MLQLGIVAPTTAQASLLTLRISAALSLFVEHQEGRTEQEGALNHSGPAATHHIRHLEASKREDYGIGGGGHRQHEGQGGRERAGEHDVERVEADGLSLDGETGEQN